MIWFSRYRDIGLEKVLEWATVFYEIRRHTKYSNKQMMNKIRGW